MISQSLRVRNTLFGAVLGAQLIVCTPALMAQAISTTSPPPTYDYDSAIAGVQGPKSELLNKYTYRSVRTYQFTVPVLVSLSELTYLLPSGFTPVATPAGSSNATMNLSFFLDQRFQLAQDGPAYGPTSAVLGYVTAFNSQLQRQELVFPLFEASSDIDALNKAFGDGSARQAHVSASVAESGGVLHFQFDISDPEIGFRLRAKAECPAAINNRGISDPVGLPFRTLNGLQPNGAFRAASQSDSLSLSPAAANLQLTVPGHRLSLRNGPLSIVGIGSSITFNRGVEFILQFE